jgi:hypothetical protein
MNMNILKLDRSTISKLLMALQIKYKQNPKLQRKKSITKFSKFIVRKTWLQVFFIYNYRTHCNKLLESKLQMLPEHVGGIHPTKLTITLHYRKN